MQTQSIIQYAEQVTGEIASRYAGDPVTELDVWLRLAHQREAMVTQLYELSKIEARLKAEPAGELSGLIRSVILSIWAHETSHTGFLSTLRGASDSTTALAAIQGRVEGWVTERALKGSALARMLIAAGAAVGNVPEFAQDLQNQSLVEVLEFSAELETTARLGYQRILQLAAQAQAEGAPDKFGFAFRYDMAKILAEEDLHEAVFVEMSRWLRAGGASAALSVEGATRALHGLCEKHLSVGALRRLAASDRSGLEAFIPGDPDQSWVSDGGLGSLLEAAGLSVPVVGDHR